MSVQIEEAKALTQKRIDSLIPTHLKKQDLFGIKLRNPCCAKNRPIPRWVDIHSVGLDQFFTRSEVAKQCWNSLDAHLCSKDIHIEDHTFIEPSTLGTFYDCLPTHQHRVIDVISLLSDSIQSEFLCWTPQVPGDQHLCVGNPTFGQVWQIGSDHTSIPKEFQKPIATLSRYLQ